MRLLSRMPDRAREKQADVGLLDDGSLERARFRSRLEAELLAEPHAIRAIARESLVRASERVEGEHLRAVTALAEAVERRCGLGVRQARREIELRQRGVRGLEARAENAALVAAAQVEGPGRVGLVLENLAAHELERVLERRPGEPGRLARGALEQLVEAVEVERDEVGVEPIRLGLRDHERPGPFTVRREVTAKNGDEGLERAGHIPRPLVAPQELGQPIGRHPVAPGREQDLEHLLRSCPAQVAWPEGSRAVLDREWPEQPHDRSLGARRRLAHGFSPTVSRTSPEAQRTTVPLGRIRPYEEPWTVGVDRSDVCADSAAVARTRAPAVRPTATKRVVRIPGESPGQADPLQRIGGEAAMHPAP